MTDTDNGHTRETDTDTRAHTRQTDTDTHAHT